ncbi:MAG: peptidylprolyl isomerase [Bacteroidales bacterium]|nr:peptidylprolyl isomerase [Bacteroidales bacterium]
MKKVFVLFALFVLGFNLNLFAQTDNSVVMEIAGEKITKSEFLKMYNRNNHTPGNIDKKDLDAYLDLFINYKLKLLQARELGLDTLQSYLEEVDKYRQQLIVPYLNDAQVTQSLIEEAYERTKTFIRASHILISLPENANPTDTLNAYNQAMNIREKALKGEDFSVLAKLYSDDPSAKDKKEQNYKGNGGDLGYFTSMTMIYPFENACYSMNVGEVSTPIKTRFGYHIIKLVDKIPAFFSTVDLSHILVGFDSRSEQESEKIINEVYAKLQEGNVSFDSLVRVYSDDKSSASTGGVLKNQKVNTIPANYVLQLSKLKEGEISAPFKTPFGWHIIKPISYKEIPSLEKQRSVIENRISKDERSFKSLESFADKSMQEYGFVEDKEGLKEIEKILTDSVFSATWTIPADFANNSELFRIGDFSFTVYDLAKEIEKHQRTQPAEYLPYYLEKLYNTVVLEQVVNYADSKLEDKYPEIKSEIKEFSDGVLIFSITDQMVWNKSLIDTLGLQKYFAENQQKYNWNKRASVTLWNIDADKSETSKVEKILKKAVRKGWTNAEVKEKLSRKLKIKEDVDKKIVFKWGKYEKGDNKIVDDLFWSDTTQEKGTVKLYENKGKKIMFLILDSWLDVEPKNLDECRGLVTSDYQSYLEKQWIESLRTKYQYKVYQDVYNTIK